MSTIKVTNIQDTSGGNNSTTEQIEAGRAKAWVNFQGTGTVTIRDDYNVNTITDHGTGDYTVNFSSSVTNSNHATVVQGSGDVNGQHTVGFLYYIRNTYTSGAVSVGFFRVDGSGTRADQLIANVAVFN